MTRPADARGRPVEEGSTRDAHAYATLPLDELYRWFAGEAQPTSPVWGRLCRWIADTPAVLDRLDTLPGRKRQPNLFLAALRHLGGPTDPGRCAVLAPLLASLPQPVALLEAGASAGLCLLPDRYRYSYRIGGVEVARSAATVHAGDLTGAPRTDPPVLTCDVAGTPPAHPDALRVAFRAGIDPNPLRADDPDDARWLRALVWPGEEARERRLADALALAASDPPPVAPGRLPDDLDRLLALAPAGATPVFLHSATLAYLTRPERDAVEARVRAAGVRWVSFEGPTVVSSLRRTLPASWSDRPHFVLALDGEPVARAGAHGGWVEWLPGGGVRSDAPEGRGAGISSPGRCAPLR